jgi:YgiT-type zinc finger domain-containing protein
MAHYKGGHLDPRFSTETIMTCLVCKHGCLTPGVTTITVERGATTIVIQGVPADVCDTCGEDYLEASIATGLDDILRRATETGVRFEVRGYAAA